MGEMEIEELKNQIGTLRVLYLALVMIVVITVISFQMQYSRIQSYYQSSFEQNQEILQILEKQNEHLRSLLSERN